MLKTGYQRYSLCVYIIIYIYNIRYPSGYLNYLVG